MHAVVSLGVMGLWEIVHFLQSALTVQGLLALRETTAALVG
jgi:hypothetical protein